MSPPSLSRSVRDQQLSWRNWTQISISPNDSSELALPLLESIQSHHSTIHRLPLLHQIRGPEPSSPQQDLSWVECFIQVLQAESGERQTARERGHRVRESKPSPAFP